MVSRIWLHIGTEKTGTTSIQSFLKNNRDALVQLGTVVPVSAGRQNHLALTGYAQADATIDDVRIAHAVRTPDEVPPYRARVEQELFAELADVKGQVVLTNEHLSSRLRTRPEIARLKVLLDRIAPRTTVVVYLRNQVDFLASWYSTSVKAGSILPMVRPLPLTVAEMMDYAKLLADWSAVFGRDNVVARRFVTADFPDGDLIADFAGVIGLDAAGLPRPERLNEALDVECLAFLRQFNRHVPRIENGRLNPLRKPIVAVIERASEGPAYRLPAPFAEQIAASYADTNAVVAAAYFPGLAGPLFPPPDAPAQAAELTDDAASFARIAGELWKANVTQMRVLEQQLRECRQALRKIRREE